MLPSTPRESWFVAACCLVWSLIDDGSLVDALSLALLLLPRASQHPHTHTFPQLCLLSLACALLSCSQCMFAHTSICTHKSWQVVVHSMDSARQPGYSVRHCASSQQLQLQQPAAAVRQQQLLRSCLQQQQPVKQHPGEVTVGFLSLRLPCRPVTMSCVLCDRLQASSRLSYASAPRSHCCCCC